MAQIKGPREAPKISNLAKRWKRNKPGTNWVIPDEIKEIIENAKFSVERMMR